jgi:cell division protein FtsN
VQLGVFAKAGNATRLARAAHNKGFAVRVTRSAHGLYRVALTDLPGHAAAVQTARRLHAAGLPSAIMGPR